MVNWNYTRQKVDEAVGALAAGQGSLGDRLRGVLNTFGVLNLAHKDADPDIARRVSEIYDRLCEVDSATDDELVELAKEIHGLSSTLWHRAIDVKAS